MKEALIYRISEWFKEGQATLGMYCAPSTHGGFYYYFSHDELKRYCDSFEEAINLACEEWERGKGVELLSLPNLNSFVQGFTVNSVVLSILSIPCQAWSSLVNSTLTRLPRFNAW
ncbi:MAG: hypothetical protein ACRCU2_23820 [Planktothrix sp.]